MSSRHARAYTDSEDDESGAAPGSPRRSPSTARAADAKRASVPSPKAGPSKPSSADHRIRLTVGLSHHGAGPSLRAAQFRPSLHHLVDPAPSAPASAEQPDVDRSSLSPPPPITLKLGRNPHYSGPPSQMPPQSRPMGFSSDEDEPPAKKARKGSDGKKGRRDSPHGSPVDAGAGTDVAVPAARQKSYDWLQPAAAGSSHPPPERKVDERQRESLPTSGPLPSAPESTPGEEESDAESASAADAAISEALGMDPPGSSPAPDAGESIRGDKKASAKKRRRAEAGPGKAWRKGLKKWVRRAETKQC